MTRLKTPLGTPARSRISAERVRRGRDKIRRLEHDRIAVGERRRDLPRRDRHREIPRRDHSDDPDRLPGHLDVDVRSKGGEFLACDAQNLAREEVEDLPGAGDFADRLREGLAFFAGQQSAEFVAPRRYLVRDAQKNVVALLRGRADQRGKADFAAAIAASVWTASACA